MFSALLERDPTAEEASLYADGFESRHLRLSEIIRQIKAREEFQRRILYTEFAISDLPDVCFDSEQSRKIPGTVRVLRHIADQIDRLRFSKHGENPVESLKDITLELDSVPEFLRIATNHSGFHLKMGRGCSGIWNFNIFGPDVKIDIGDGTTSNGTDCMINKGSRLSFGKDCMVATTEIHVGDNHAIFDIETGALLNVYDEPFIEIGDHVWLASRTRVLTNTKIGSGSIIAAGALARGSIDPCSLVTGVPGRTARTGVSWTRGPFGEDRERVTTMLQVGGTPQTRQPEPLPLRRSFLFRFVQQIRKYTLKR